MNACDRRCFLKGTVGATTLNVVAQDKSSQNRSDNIAAVAQRTFYVDSENGRDENVWFSNQGVTANYFGKLLERFDEYQKTTGLDKQSVLADPRFIDPEQSDYRVSSDSPARTLRADGGSVGAKSF